MFYHRLYGYEGRTHMCVVAIAYAPYAEDEVRIAIVEFDDIPIHLPERK